jgi:hypothetical protein
MIMTDLSYPVLELIVLEYYRISDPTKEKPLVKVQVSDSDSRVPGDLHIDKHRRRPGP